MRSSYCGRIDAHEPHEWLGRNHDCAVPSIVRECPGAPVIEGGAGPYLRNWSDEEPEDAIEPIGPQALALAREHAGEVPC